MATRWKPIAEEEVRRIAHIVGYPSGAAAALREADRLRAEGQSYRFWSGNRTIIIEATGPKDIPERSADAP